MTTLQRNHEKEKKMVIVFCLRFVYCQQIEQALNDQKEEAAHLIAKRQALERTLKNMAVGSILSYATDRQTQVPQTQQGESENV